MTHGPTRNDLIEEQILQIETDRALHSVGSPQLVEAAGSQRPGGGLDSSRKGIWFQGPIQWLPERLVFSGVFGWKIRMLPSYGWKICEMLAIEVNIFILSSSGASFTVTDATSTNSWPVHAVSPCFFVVGKNLRTWSHKKERSGWFQSPPIWERWCLWGLVGCPAHAGPFHSTYSLQKRVADIFFFFL